MDTKGIIKRQEILSKTSAVHLKYIYCGNVVDSRCNAERLEFPGVGGVFFERDHICGALNIIYLGGNIAIDYD